MEYYIRGEIFRGTQVFFVTYVNSKQLFLKRVFENGRFIYAFTESSENITYFTLRKYRFGLSFQDNFGDYLGEFESLATPVSDQKALIINTNEVNQFGLALAGVFYAFSLGSGACINFTSTEGLQSLVMIVPNLIFGRETFTDQCMRIDDVLPREIAWFKGNKDFRSWTTQIQCESNNFYQYCKGNLTCGEINNCYGPCDTAQICALNDEGEYGCENINEATYDREIFILTIVAIIIVTFIVFFGAYYLLRVVYEK